jgi:hypothetical protein
MQTPLDILENQPYNLLEDEIIDIDDVIIPDTANDTSDDTDDNSSSDSTKQKKSTTFTTQDDDEPNVFAVLAKDFKEKGLANFADDWDGDEEEFRDQIYGDIKASVLEDFKLTDPVVAGFLNYVSNGGDAGEFIQQLSMSSALTAKDEDVYMMYMKSTTNFSDEKIKKLMDKAKELDDFQDDVEEMREEIKLAQTEQIEKMNKTKEEEKKRVAYEMREDAKRRRELVGKKELMGIPVVKNKEFEKFYLTPSENYKYENQDYKITPYQKRLLDRHKNKAEYETFLAYLEFIDYKLPSEKKEAVAAATSALKGKLQPFISKGGRTTLIDEN